MAVRYSHPPEGGHGGVPLLDHLKDVAQRVEYVVPENARTPAGEPVQDIVETLAYVHDFGKATTYFQQYLGVLPGTPKSEQYRYHAPIGSFAAYYALDARGFDVETCLAGFVAVAKHHGRLPDVAAYVFERSHRRPNVSAGNQNAAERQQAIIAKQLEDVNDHVPELASEVLQRATVGDGSWRSFHDDFGKLLKKIESAVATTGTNGGINRGALSDSCYGLVLECWGVLVLADKTSAASDANGESPSAGIYKAETPDIGQIDEHVEKLERNANADPNGTRTERLNHHRSRARRTVLKSAKRFADNGGGVATLTLPTGMGKTLSGLSAALAIRDRLGGDRIVYALPFTSIIDQVVHEIENIYETDTTGRLLTAHHHLSETTIRDSNSDTSTADEADQNDDIAAMLAESWRAGLTVTTFVQLFESLAGPSNVQSMKLPALRDSVIILDEPQSLPLDWWKLVPRLVTLLTDRYNATVIAMTATQPRLFDNETELVDDPDVYFEATERVRYNLDPSTQRYIDTQSDPKSYDDATLDLLKAIEEGNSALAVCNTIDSARKLTDHVIDADPGITDVGSLYTDELERTGDVKEIDSKAVANRILEASERAVLHLSTRLRPADRLRLIEIAKRLTADEHALVTISTQLVEAGVDISFDRVYRDLAPIDSIVQAAGRCNRSFERDRGDVTVWWLDAPEEQQKTPAEAVYNRGPALLPVAAETLNSVRNDSERISETVVARTAVERYYQRLHEEKNVGKQAYATYVDEARGDKLAELSLIDQRLAIDVIVCRTDEDRRRIDEIKEAWSAYEFDTVRDKLDETKPTRVSVPVYRADSEEAQTVGSLDRVHDETDLRWIDTRRHLDYFDETTGLIVPDTTVEGRFL